MKRKGKEGTKRRTNLSSSLYFLEQLTGTSIQRDDRPNLRARIRSDFQGRCIRLILPNASRRRHPHRHRLQAHLHLYFRSPATRAASPARRIPKSQTPPIVRDSAPIGSGGQPARFSRAFPRVRGIRGPPRLAGSDRVPSSVDGGRGARVWSL